MEKAQGSQGQGQGQGQVQGQQQQQQQQQSQNANAAAAASGARQGGMPLADLNRIVLEYLNKKGYNRTEAMLRIESSRAATPAGLTNATNGTHVANRPLGKEATPGTTKEDPAVFYRAYALLKDWAENSLDLYRPELKRMCYPIFVHMFLDLVSKDHSTQAKQFFEEFAVDHELLHGQDIEKLAAISLSSHLEENELAIAFRKNKFVVKVSQTSFDLLVYFLQEIENTGGSIIIRVLNQYVDTKISGTRPTRYDTEMSVDPEEGLPESENQQQLEKLNSQPVKLGAMQADPDFDKEIQANLEKDDDKEMTEQYQKIKAETEDGPSRETLPLPQPKSIDLDMAIKNIGETKKRIEMGPKHQAALPSVCMYTFHNSHDSLNSLTFSEDSELVAGGFSDSFVKVWSLKGEKLHSVLKNDEPSTTRRLVGHSGAVYNTSFSPDNRYLLSCSEDKTVRLWSMDTYTGLVSYRGHNHPVWDVSFSPHGHYFATASHDQTARLWSCDHIYPLRIFAGHNSDVDNVEFHPNGTYVMTGSSDKTCRMWDISRGNSVRVFMGHSQPVNALAVSPDGRWLASSCEDGVIIIWDLGSGRKLKHMRGHGRSFIYSLAFSRDGNVLVSAGADNSVRVWDVKRGTNEDTLEPEPYSMATESNENQNNNDKTDPRKREVVASPDHMAVFHTKKTPVYNVHFTRRNLCLAGGAFMG